LKENFANVLKTLVDIAEQFMADIPTKIKNDANVLRHHHFLSLLITRRAQKSEMDSTLIS
jgi:hypothetical protein